MTSISITLHLCQAALRYLVGALPLWWAGQAGIGQGELV